MRHNKGIALISLMACLLCMVLLPVAADNASLEARVADLETTVRRLVELLARDGGGYSDQFFRAFARSLDIDVPAPTHGELDEREGEWAQEEDDEGAWEEEGEWEGEHPAQMKSSMRPTSTKSVE